MSVPVNQMPPGKVDRWWRRAGCWLCPPRCLACGEAGSSGTALCRTCMDLLPWNRHACARCAVPLPAGSAGQACGDCLQRPLPLTAVHAAFVYAFPVDRLLPRFKFHHDLAAGHLLATAMHQALAAAPRPDALIAVPLHRARLRSRGYDQALELARPLSAALALPTLPDALRRQRPTLAQSRLDAPARRRNLRDAFVVGRDRLPSHVALVDDVMTTGATLHAAARTLQRAGVARVDAWVCARVP